ncbi:uncharacterized protein PG986_004134 [Apiospora aurea]|uniref:Uncharacterized protein n=1 Tax=Apiospora aurea TaxID=335848 RepID=A0ABR1QLQ5_9PEZI
MASKGTIQPSNRIVYAVFLVCVLSHGVLASTSSRFMGRLLYLFIFLNMALVALAVGRTGQRNGALFIFAEVDNLTAWPAGWAFMLAWLSPIGTIGSFDACLSRQSSPSSVARVYMSEEASNAAIAVPMGILSSAGMCWGLGFIIVIVLAHCIPPDIESILHSRFGQPMAQIYYGALGKQGALGFVAFLFVVQYSMGLSICVAASRQVRVFSRDGALPFSRFIRPVVIEALRPRPRPRHPGLRPRGGASLYYFLDARKWFRGPGGALAAAEGEDAEAMEEEAAGYIVPSGKMEKGRRAVTDTAQGDGVS